MDVDLAPNKFYPQRSYLTFSQQPKFENLTKKLLEFNEKVEADDKIEDQKLNRLHLLASPGKLFLL